MENVKYQFVHVAASGHEFVMLEVSVDLSAERRAALLQGVAAGYAETSGAAISVDSEPECARFDDQSYLEARRVRPEPDAAYYTDVLGAGIPALTPFTRADWQAWCGAEGERPRIAYFQHDGLEWILVQDAHGFALHDAAGEGVFFAGMKP